MPNRILMLVLLSLPLSGCDLEGRSPTVSLAQVNGDCVGVTFDVDEGVVGDGATVFIDYGDGTTYEGDDFPAHEYCHQGVYTVSVGVSSDEGSATYPNSLFVYDTAFPTLETFLGSTTDGTELHTLNLVRVSSPNNFNRNYGTHAKLFWLNYDDTGALAPLEGDPTAEIQREDGPVVVTLDSAATGIARRDIDLFRHTEPPKWMLDGEVVADGTGRNFPTVNNGNEFELDLPLRVEPHSIGEPLTLSMLKVATGGVNGFYYVVRRLETVRVFEPEGVNGSVTLSADDLAEFGPGPMEIWAVAQGRYAVEEGADVTFVNSFVEGKTIALVADSPDAP